MMMKNEIETFDGAVVFVGAIIAIDLTVAIFRRVDTLAIGAAPLMRTVATCLFRVFQNRFCFGEFPFTERFFFPKR